ncbi:amidase [Haloplanus sp. GCM10025708]|uniref:amidase n=1 Tax=Haloferacaceae TaxID=1644056 RepID=UPI003620F605
MTVEQTSLADVAASLRDGDREIPAYLDECYERMDAHEPDVRAFVPEPKRRERLDAEAAAMADRYPDPVDRPPLYGVPVGVKDIFHVDGLPTRGGSDLPRGKLAGPQSEAVTALREAGALVMGKTVTTEFAYFEPGPTRNPHDTDHTPGGSSSGSAAAVAAGMCPIALGTQTIGSVVRPAAFCGVVGYKPSFGRIPTGGVLPLSESLDHVGIFTQDLAGMELAASLCCDEWDAAGDVSRPTLGVPEGPYLDQASETGRAHFADHVEALEAAGYEVRRVDVFGDIEALNERHVDLMAAEAALVHHEWLETLEDRYAESTLEMLCDGRSVTAEELAAGRHSRTDLRAELETVMDDRAIDAWVSPAAPGPAPEGIDSTGDPAMNLPWTHAGVPAVTLPASESTEGLPLGLQCTARFGDDERLLAWADGMATALD